MSTKTLITLEEFFRMPEDDTGYTYELDRGELIAMPPSAAKHEIVNNRIAEVLILFLQGKSLGTVLTETGFTIDPESWRRPDVSFVRAERLRQIDREKPLEGAPDLAVEVYSPSDSMRVLTRKVRHYLETGVKAVWVVYPDPREVQVVEPAGERWLGEADVLDAPEILPGFSIPVKSLFEQ